MFTMITLLGLAGLFVGLCIMRAKEYDWRSAVLLCGIGVALGVGAFLL